jgi:hypothetical protein
MENIKKKSLEIFEKPLTSLGKSLDEYLNEISFEPKHSNKKKEDNDNIIVKNEILSLFNKSKIDPTQFASMIVMNNIYIENEKPGDWTRLKTYEVEEMMNNIRHENDDDSEDEQKNKTDQSVSYKTTVRQRFGDNT